MISWPFFKQVLTLPYKLLKTIISYYTVGTVYTNTNREFNTLFKNIQLSIENHFGHAFQLQDVPIVLYKPFDKLLIKFKSNPMVSKGNLSHFGEKHDDHSYWIHKVDTTVSKDVLIYFHGGGFALPCFDAQLAGFIMMHHALPQNLKEKLSFLIVDYSLTYHEDCKFPTQIYEALDVYKKLLDQGYTNIHIIGDSAGGNLSLALIRYLSHPEETDYFSQFKQFDFTKFATIDVQPSSLILISPWVKPLTPDPFPTDFDSTGDLGSTRKEMGLWYLPPGLEQDDKLADWMQFAEIDSKKYANIELFKSDKTMCIYGDRENLKRGIESLLSKMNEVGPVKTYVEKGGIHVGLFYVESLDYLGYGGIKAINGQFDDKYSLGIVTEFLTNVVKV